MIFRLTKKFVTSFVSIGSEVTSFLNFLKFAFCRCCYVASASLLPVQVAHWTKDQPATSDQSSAHSWQTRTNNLRLLLPAVLIPTSRLLLHKASVPQKTHCDILYRSRLGFPLRSILRRQPARTTLRCAPSPPLRFGPAGVLVRHPADSTSR